jgi:hypothetical protein
MLQISHFFYFRVYFHTFAQYRILSYRSAEPIHIRPPGSPLGFPYTSLRTAHVPVYFHIQLVFILPYVYWFKRCLPFRFTYSLRSVHGFFCGILFIFHSMPWSATKKNKRPENVWPVRGWPVGVTLLPLPWQSSAQSATVRYHLLPVSQSKAQYIVILLVTLHTTVQA